MLRSVYTIKLLRITLGAFFIVLGVLGVLTNVDESIFKLNNGNITLEVIFGVVEIICGLLLLLGFFAFGTSKAVSMGGIVVLIFWIARVVLTKFVWCFHSTKNGISFYFTPNFELWILTLITELVILASLLVVIKKYD